MLMYVYMCVGLHMCVCVCVCVCVCKDVVSRTRALLEQNTRENS